MSREHLEYPVSCPNCINNGSIIISSNDYPFMTKEDRRIDKIEGAFSVQICNDEEIILKCNNCGKQFKTR